MGSAYRLPEPGGLPEPYRLPERMPSFLQHPSQDWYQLLNKIAPLPPPLPRRDPLPAPTYFVPRAPAPSAHSFLPKSDFSAPLQLSGPVRASLIRQKQNAEKFGLSTEWVDSVLRNNPSSSGDCP